MKIVITGALGHIGSSVVRTLPADFPDAEIVMIDSLITQRYASLFNLPERGNYRFVEADVRNAKLAGFFDGARAVIHLAAMTDAAGSVERAAAVEENNYEATKNVATTCFALGLPMIHLSSTSVYGTQSGTVDEECAESELKPQSPYAETKLREERLIRTLCEQGLKAVICRFGTIFGPSPGMRFHTAVNKFCWQAVMGQPLTVWRTAYDQKRPYLDLSDAVQALSFIIKNDIFDARTYNVLTLNTTVRGIVDAIRQFVPDAQINFVDNAIMNQLSYEVSARRIYEKGFRPSGDISRSIGATISMLKSANTSVM